MKPEHAKELIMLIAQRGVHVPLLLVGPMGVGKSWAPKEAAKEMGIACIDLRLAQQEVGDLTGLPRRDGKRTFWSKPEWWPDDPNSKGILFLDELNRAPLDVLQAVFQLVGEWKLHTHVLPAGWIIVSAINPDNGSYQVDSLDIAMLRRFCQVKVLPTPGGWIKWAEQYGIDQRIIQFIKFNGKMLSVKEEFDIEARPTPEGYRLVHEILSAKAIPSRLEQEVISGLIGTEAAVALTCHFVLGAKEFVSGYDILNRYGEVKTLLLAQTNDELYESIESLVDLLIANSTYSTNSQLNNLTACLKDLPDEWKMNLLSGIEQEDHLLDHISRNAELNRSILRLGSKIENATPKKGGKKRTKR